MKRYYSLGELLADYREINKLSQSEFAAILNVDSRTVQRWERNETLLKSEKEEEIVVKTLLPYQLIRNLNASVVIPTYYDFAIRKYSLTELSIDLPEAATLKRKFSFENSNIRKIDYAYDRSYLENYLTFPKKASKNILKAIEKAIKLLPELNLIITDDSGYYSGHSIVFPISEKAYEKLRNREMTEDELTEHDLVDYKQAKRPIFYNYDISTDCNNSIFFLLHQIFHFFNQNTSLNYLYCKCAVRYDSFRINEQMGLKIIWEDGSLKQHEKVEVFPRFYEGDFKEFLKDSEL